MKCFELVKYNSHHLSFAVPRVYLGLKHSYNVIKHIYIHTHTHTHIKVGSSQATQDLNI